MKRFNLFSKVLLFIDMVLQLVVTTHRSEPVSQVEGEVSGLHDSHPQPQSQGASKLCTWSPSPSHTLASSCRSPDSRMMKDGLTACVSVTRAVGARASSMLPPTLESSLGIV